MAEPGKSDTAAIGSALVHLYRGEVARADTWRSRLDNTTNWALTTTAAVVSIGLGSRVSHAVFLVGMFLVINFLLIETRRYRAWDVFLRRVRILEVSLYAPLLRGELPDRIRLRELASMLEAPRVVIPFAIALGQRVKRAYGPVLAVLFIAWLVRLLFNFSELRGPLDFIARMRVGFLPGVVVLILVGAAYTLLGMATGYSLLARPPATELLAARRPRRPLRDVFVRAAASRAP